MVIKWGGTDPVQAKVQRVGLAQPGAIGVLNGAVPESLRLHLQNLLFVLIGGGVVHHNQPDMPAVLLIQNRPDGLGNGLFLIVRA